jgi:uncharacterized alkaline shock family protein YloU
MAMKISFSERLLLALTGILGVFFAGALGVAAYLGDKLVLTAGSYKVQLYSGLWPALAAGVVALIVLIWSLKLLSLAFKREPRMDRSSVSVQHTENGSVRISVAAMDTLVKQAIAHDEGVVDIKTSIINHEDSISVSIDMTLASDVHIPNVTMMMQRSIKNFIEEFSGIAVREVTIMVSKIIEVTPQPPLHLNTPEPAKALKESTLPKLEQKLHQEPELEPQTVADLEPEKIDDLEAEKADDLEPENIADLEPERPLDLEPEPEPEVQPEAPEELPQAESGEIEEEQREPGEVNEKDVW